MSAPTIDQQFVEFIVKSLVSKPESVVVERTIDEKGVLLKLTVDPEDLGRVIGKRGSTAQSIRTLLRALGTKNDARYNLKIVDNGERPERTEETAPEQEQTQEQESPSEETESTSSEATVEESTEETVEETSSIKEKHRKDLEELSDLDL